MSLINEALQRARQEAAARMEAEELPGTYLTAPRHMPPRAVWKRNLLIGIGLLIPLALAVWLVVGPTAANDLPAVVGGSPEAATRLNVDRPPDGSEASPELRADPATSPVPGAVGRSLDQPHPPVSADSTETPARGVLASPATPAAAPVGGRPAGTAGDRQSQLDEIPFIEPNLRDGSTAAAGLNGKVFVREVELPGYGPVELSGIAGSVAVLGGRIVSRGELVGGFELVEIEPDGVVFSGRGATFRLRLR